MRDLLHEILDEEKIRKSGRDLAVVTFDLTSMKPREIFIEDMEQGQLLEYILASSAFPGFDRPVIRGKRHMDGGVYNNLPYDLATSRGYRNIIVADLSGIGVNRRINTRGTTTTYIKISMEIGGPLDFDRRTLERLRTLGYLDSLKAFGHLIGHDYFLDPEDSWEQAFAAFLLEKLGTAYRKRIGRMGVLPAALRHERRLLYPLLDSAASALRLERIKRYSYAELSEAIVRASSQIDQKIAAISGDGGSRRFLRTARRIRRGRKTATRLPRSPYYYARLLARPDSPIPRRMAIRTLRTIFPELAGAAFLVPELESFLEFVRRTRA